MVWGSLKWKFRAIHRKKDVPISVRLLQGHGHIIIIWFSFIVWFSFNYVIIYYVIQNYNVYI